MDSPQPMRRKQMTHLGVVLRAAEVSVRVCSGHLTYGQAYRRIEGLKAQKAGLREPSQRGEPTLGDQVVSYAVAVTEGVYQRKYGHGPVNDHLFI